MRQKTWKKRLAVVLAAAMALNAGALTSFARWEEEDDGWHFYTESDGTPVIGKVKKIQGEWYSFDENGVMETNKWIQVDGSDFYIKPSGQFAVNKWMFLDEEGHKCTHTEGCGCKWYRLGNITEEGGQLTGGVVKEELKEIDGAWYSFDPEDGVMRSDQLIYGISEERPEEIFYAYEDGHLITQSWVQLTEDGHLAKGDEKASWYYFKNVEKGRGMARDGETEIKGKWYAFDEDGHMLTRQWYPSEDGYYYQYEGERAVDKSLYIDNEWYRFDSKGVVVATASDAARKRVEKIEPIGETAVKAEVGKEVTLKFQLTEPAEDKASTSNAMRNFTNDHDVGLRGRIEGRFLSDKVSISEDGVCTIVYKNDKVNGEGDKILLVIDDVEATEPVVVTTQLPKDDSGNEITEDEHTIENIINKKEDFQPGEEKEAVEQLTTIYKEKFDDEKKGAFEDQWLENPVQFDKLEEAYKTSQRIETKAPEVAEEVKDELDGDVSVAGAAFSAPAGSTIELKVKAPADNSWREQLSGTFNKQVAFDISLLFDGENKSELKMPVVITVPVPKTFEGISAAELKADLKLYNIHGDEAIEVKITVNAGKVSFLTDRFSTYVFAMNSSSNSGGNSGYGGGRSSGGSRSTSNTIAGTLSGQWQLDEKGWWFRLDNGSYAVDSWQYVAYNGVARWYRFDANGYICKGWFTDADGHRYYLNPASDGLMGAMLTGWQQIDGIWYYFNTVSDGTQGALLVSATTPDGYSVDANGQWIQ